MTSGELCPCQSGGVYGSCCGPYFDGVQTPPTAESLMRSRYTAYVMRREDYLLETWHPRTRPATLGLDASVQWRGLEVVRKESGNSDDGEGVVEFVARYKIGGRAERLHEVSRFTREEGRWYYVDGYPGAKKA